MKKLFQDHSASFSCSSLPLDSLCFCNSCPPSSLCYSCSCYFSIFCNYISVFRYSAMSNSEVVIKTMLSRMIATAIIFDQTVLKIFRLVCLVSNSSEKSPASVRWAMTLYFIRMRLFTFKNCMISTTTLFSLRTCVSSNATISMSWGSASLCYSRFCSFRFYSASSFCISTSCSTTNWLSSKSSKATYSRSASLHIETLWALSFSSTTTLYLPVLSIG